MCGVVRAGHSVFLTAVSHCRCPPIPNLLWPVSPYPSLGQLMFHPRLTRTRPTTIHHKGHSDWNGDGLVSGRAGEGQDSGQRALAASCGIRDTNRVRNEAGQPK